MPCKRRVFSSHTKASSHSKKKVNKFTHVSVQAHISSYTCTANIMNSIQHCHMAHQIQILQRVAVVELSKRYQIDRKLAALTLVAGNIRRCRRSYGEIQSKFTSNRGQHHGTQQSRHDNLRYWRPTFPQHHKNREQKRYFQKSFHMYICAQAHGCVSLRVDVVSNDH